MTKATRKYDKLTPLPLNNVYIDRNHRLQNLYIYVYDRNMNSAPNFDSSNYIGGRFPVHSTLVVAMVTILKVT